MRTTVDIPDRLLREARARAALEGRKLKDIVNDALIRLLSDNQQDADPKESHPDLPAGVSLESVGRFRLPLIRSASPGTMHIDPKALKASESKEDEDRHAALFGR